MRKAARWKERVPLHDCNGNFLQYVIQTAGMRMVECGTAMAVKDYRYGRVCVLRYQETEGATASSSAASMPMITAGEMSANVLRSWTARLPEWDTLGRDSKHARELAHDPKMPAEDFIEQAQNRVRMWTRVPLLNPRHVAWATAARAARA